MIKRQSSDRVRNMGTYSARRIVNRQTNKHRGFSLIELIVVLSITMILTSILMPALKGIRDHTERLISQSNQRQIGMGITMFYSDHSSRLPESKLQRQNPPRLQEMMALYVGNDSPFGAIDKDGNEITFEGWDGLGLLYSNKYLDVPNIFYCPSYHGDHPLERYQNQFNAPEGWIYANYHYRGDRDFETNRNISLERDSHRVFVTDGLRTRRDLNHKNGYNSLYGDGSVIWTSDMAEELYNTLPVEPLNVMEGVGVYKDVWDLID